MPIALVNDQDAEKMMYCYQLVRARVGLGYNFEAKQNFRTIVLVITFIQGNKCNAEEIKPSIYTRAEIMLLSFSMQAECWLFNRT